MGSGWSQDEASQLSQPSEQPSNNKAVEEKVTEAKPTASKPMAVEKTAAQYPAKLSAKNNHEAAAAVREVKEVGKKTAAQQVLKQQLPHNYEAIVRDADSPINNSSVENLLVQLHAGIFLNQKRKKYWVDKKLNNCFMVYARDLSITWGEDKRYWHWPSVQETSDASIDVAELLNVCWLEVHGKLETTKLTPGTLYEVVIVVKLKDGANGWNVPVNLGLSLPDGNKQIHKVNLMEFLGKNWIEIPIGELTASPEKIGDIMFSMYEYDGGKWKKGLVIKGVAVRPKY